MSVRQSILVVDEDESLLDLLQMALQDEGFEVIASQDAEQALDLLDSVSPSLILLDTWMQDAKGRAFAEAYKTHSSERAPLLIMTTGKSSDNWAADLGAEGCMNKPFDIESLVAAVRKHARGETQGCRLLQS